MAGLIMRLFYTNDSGD